MGSFRNHCRGNDVWGYWSSLHFGAVASLIAGIGFVKADKQYKKIWKEIGNAAE